MCPTIQKGNFWLIDDLHNVEAYKKIQLMTEWDDPNHKKEKLKVWNTLVVWGRGGGNDIRLNDISHYFNIGNKKWAYQIS